MKKINSFIIAFLACLCMACEDEVVPDTQAPTVKLSSPLAESAFEQDEEIAIRAEVKDDFALESVTISIKSSEGETRVLQTLGEEHFSSDRREATVDHSFSPEGEPAGNYTFTIEASDKAGNTSEEKVSVLIRAADTNAPAITIHSPEEAAEYYPNDVVHLQALISDASALEQVTLSLTAPGEEARVIHTVNEESFTNDKREANIDQHIELGADPGNYIITIQAKDKKANAGDKSIHIVMREPDTNAPVISIQTPEEETEFYPDDVIPFEAHVLDEAALESVTVSISSPDGNTLSSHRVESESFFNNNKEVNISKAFSLGSNPAPGVYTIKVQALDIYGNVGKESTGIHLLASNPNAPAISILSPEEGSEFLQDEEITLQANIIDDTALESVSVSLTAPRGQSQEIFTVNEADFFNEDKEAEINEPVSLGTDPAPGTYTITVVAIDQEGNKREKRVRIKVLGPDTSAPTITINSPSEGSNFKQGSEVNLDASVEDDRMLAKIHIVVMMGGVMPIHEESITEFDEDTRHQVQEVATIPDDAANGDYVVIITATDAAGNVSEETLNFQVSSDN
jgi:uncharacterized membrane protein